MGLHGLDEFLRRRPVCLEKIIKPEIFLSRILIVEDERTSSEIPVKDVLLVMTSTVVSVQVNARAGRVLPEVVV
jgi:hypothetical protein